MSEFGFNVLPKTRSNGGGTSDLSTIPKTSKQGKDLPTPGLVFHGVTRYTTAAARGWEIRGFVCIGGMAIM